MVYSKGCHTVFYHRYHVVWATKYRYQVLVGDLRLRVRQIIRQACDELDVQIVKGALSKDHVHMFIAVPPNRAISEPPRVWMPPLMQADSSVGWGHVVRCGRVSGLVLRPFIAAGLYGDMRIASLSGLRAGRRSGRFRFSRSRLVDRCPLPSFDLLTSPAHPPAAGSGGGGSPVSRLADGQRPDDPGHLVGESDDNDHARLFRHHHAGEP